MKKYFFDFTRSLAFLWLRYIRTSDGCAPRFQTTTRLHGNAQRPEINKAINKYPRLTCPEQNRGRRRPGRTSPPPPPVALPAALLWPRHRDRKFQLQPRRGTCEPVSSPSFPVTVDYSGTATTKELHISLSSVSRWTLCTHTAPFPGYVFFHVILSAFSLEESC